LPQHLGLPTRDELRGRVRKIIVEQGGVDPRTLTSKTKILDLGWDSIGTVELTMALEDAFDLEIPDAALDQLHTVQDVIDYLTDRLGL
jgi:acyl carrier protein